MSRADKAAARAREIFDQVNGEGGNPPDQLEGGGEHADQLNPKTPDAAVAGQQLQHDPTDQLAILQADRDRWAQRFNVLKGKYDSEVPRLTARVKELESQLAQVQGGGNAAVDVNDAWRILAENLGDDVVAAMRRVSAPQPAAAAHVDDQPPQADDAGQDSPIYQVRALVDTALKNPGIFDEINASAEFAEYLDGFTVETADGTVTVRQYMLASFQQGALDSVAQVFLSFMRRRSEQAKVGKDKDLNKRAVPDIPPAGGRDDSSTLPTYTRAEYETAMKDLRLNPKYRTPEGQATADKLRRELLEAMRDGRIIG